MSGALDQVVRSNRLNVGTSALALAARPDASLRAALPGPPASGDFPSSYKGLRARRLSNGRRSFDPVPSARQPRPPAPGGRQEEVGWWTRANATTVSRKCANSIDNTSQMGHNRGIRKAAAPKLGGTARRPKPLGGPTCRLLLTSSSASNANGD